MNIRLEQPEDYREMPKDDEVPFFLAQELIPGYWGDREGTYCPPKGYFVADENPEDFDEYEKTFPKKAMSYNEGQLPPFAAKTKLIMQTARLTLRPWLDSDAEALRLVIDYCFNEKKFTTLWGDYFPENPASGKVMEKCGFKDTGIETVCPNLVVGADRPVKVMKLENKTI